MVKLLQKINGNKLVYGLATMALAQNLATVFDGDVMTKVLMTIYYVGLALAGGGGVHKMTKDKKKVV